VSKVQLGLADAAIVYASDATPHLHNKLSVIEVPDSIQVIASYPIAVVRGANPSGGEAFVAYVLGPNGQAALKKWGFGSSSAE
jgi:molybdate transport system substrate-binding protein